MLNLDLDVWIGGIELVSKPLKERPRLRAVLGETCPDDIFRQCRRDLK
jgi:hypothetical protein